MHVHNLSEVALEMRRAIICDHVTGSNLRSWIRGQKTVCSVVCNERWVTPIAMSSTTVPKTRS